MERIDIGKYIVKNPEICHGQVTFRGTRVPVDTVLAYLAKGYSVDVLLHSWLQVSRPAIEEAVSLASQSLQARYAPYLSAAASTSQHDYPVIA